MVLKIPVDEETGRSEARHLERWSASGASPDVLDTADSGVYLMTRILPGQQAALGSAQSDAADFVVLLGRMNEPNLDEPWEEQPIETVARERLDWAKRRFSDSADEVRQRWLPRAYETLTELAAQPTEEPRLLHADLQAKNILTDATGKWIAIDPLGAWGDINSEAGLWAAIQPGPDSIDVAIRCLAASALLEDRRLRLWAYLFSIAEYRAYQPHVASRMTEYVAQCHRDRLLG